MGKNNIGRLFYKEYYKDVNFDEILFEKKEGTLRTAINKQIKSSECQEIENLIANSCLEATILYPGLLTGTGLVHDSKNIPGGYNLGMHFDYTFGMPVVYGSSVKGVLREYFKEFCRDCEDLKVNSNDVEDLFKAIFDGKVKENDSYVNLSVYKRDIFFDAVVKQTYGKHLLEDDSITPHTGGPLKNPIPIAMLKIAPGCVLEFRFLLHKSTINGRTYDKECKEKIFRKILQTVGIGSKTNVGYGQLKFKTE